MGEEDTPTLGVRSYGPTLLSDIIGHGSVKLRIDELVLPLGLPREVKEEIFTGIRSISSTILLHGPPGCGKVRSCTTVKRVPHRTVIFQSQLARAIAGEAQAALVTVFPSDLMSQFVGESEAAVRNMFLSAVSEGLKVDSKCAVIFLDEIDALGMSREIMAGKGDGCSRRVLTELLLHLNTVTDRTYCRMDHFQQESGKELGSETQQTELLLSEDCEDVENGYNVGQEDEVRLIVVAATNRRDDCDPALLRRFGAVLEVGLPSEKDRKKMFSRHFRGISHTLQAHDIDMLAKLTIDWSGSVIQDVCRDAAMAPVRECLHKAAKVRRRALNCQQPSGDTSQEAEHDEDHNSCARNTLEAELKNLRPVTFEDCTGAIGKLAETDIDLLLQEQHMISQRKYKRARVEEKYDSSSEEE